MNVRSFAEWLSDLDPERLTRLFDARRDVLIEPVPRNFTQLAQRLSGPGSLSAALPTLNRDTMLVSQAIAFLADSATVPAVARLLDAAEQTVADRVTELGDRGLAWVDGSRLFLPEHLHAHWAAELGGSRPLARIAPAVSVDDLRRAAAVLGVAVDGLRKPQLIASLVDAMTDPHRMARSIAALPDAARAHLDELRHGQPGIMFGFSQPRRGAAAATEQLVRAGLVLRTNRQPEVPREVAVAAWLADQGSGLAGPPAVARARVPIAAVRPAAEAAAREALLTVSVLLDEARTTPIAALKKGGVGTRERTRLAKRLSIAADALVLWIDVIHAADLLAWTDAGYAPTEAYDEWRAAEPSRQWAVLAAAWHGLEHAPLSREIEDDRELPPPLPLMSAGGAVRRALLAASREDRSVHAAGSEIDWFFPLHGYPPAQRDDKVRAAVREAELLGVVAQDRLTELGEQLVTAADLDELSRRCAELLPATPCAVVLQSDLTAVVSGQPSAAVATLLAETAVAEARGGATVWRFTPMSVRGSLDGGRTAEELLAELTKVSVHPVPQPLEYLIRDAARRHGEVRVRRTRSCVVADEALIAEIAGTRSLAKLRLARLAPTVLSSPCETDQVLKLLRAAGLSPVAEDSTGAVVVEARAEHRAEAAPVPARPRTRLSPAELAKRLTETPLADDGPSSATAALLARLNDRLAEAEIALLADAVDNQIDVVIAYRDKRGNHTIRRIRPHRIFEPWLESWCYLRNDDREFTVSKIEAVEPAG
jgi:hypothetical protein